MLGGESGSNCNARCCTVAAIWGIQNIPSSRLCDTKAWRNEKRMPVEVRRFRFPTHNVVPVASNLKPLVCQHKLLKRTINAN